VNYRFGNDAISANIVAKAPATPDLENVNFPGRCSI
jgi:hypothetical protein